MASALVRLHFNYGDLLRWLGGEYTLSHFDRSLFCDVVATVRDVPIPPGYPPVDFDGAINIVYNGVPNQADFKCSFADVERRNLHNNARLGAVADSVLEKFRKEEKLSYHIMLPRFIWRFIDGLFLAIISFVPPKADGEDGRLICDPSGTLHALDTGMVNALIPEAGTSPANAAVHYGSKAPPTVYLQPAH